MLLSLALNQLRDRFLNPAIKNFGTISTITYKQNRLVCTFSLLGLEDTPLTATCARIRIFDGENAVQFSEFTANKPFLANILNTFAARKFVLPNTLMTKAILQVLKMIL